jgi:hypothetical protein
MKRFSIFLFLFLAIADKSNGQFAFVLEGTIGRYPIVMKLNKDDAAYFYQSAKRDIELSITSEKNNVVTLQRMEWGKVQEDTVLETFVLRRTGNEWKGNWKARGKELPVVLKIIDTSSYQFNQIPFVDYQMEDAIQRIYQKARLSNLVFINDSVTRTGMYQLQWVHEKISGIKGFRVIAGYSMPVLSKVNALLAKAQYEDLLGYFTCIGRFDEFEFTNWLNHPFISPEFISFQTGSTGFCGGAHPNYNIGGFTIDVKNGKEVSNIDELYWFTGSKPPPFSYDDRYSKYDDERAKAIVALMTRLHPVEMKKPVSEDSCDYSDATRWNSDMIWYLSEKGLYIAPYFPHSSYGCRFQEFSWIPYSELVPYKTRER